MRQELIEKFRADHSDSVSTAFLIMRFSSKRQFGQIHDALRSAFSELGVRLLRADDKTYSEDLFENVRLYADCCSFGVAVFDRIEGEYFNPNVSLEVGFMLGRQKPVLLLKDETMQVLPSDLVGRLYVPLNVHEPLAGLGERLRKWLDDNAINPCSKRLSVVVRLQVPYWEYAATRDLVAGIPLFVRDAGPAYYKGIRKAGENFVIDYDVSCRFSEELKKMHQRGDFSRLAGLSIVEIEASDEQPALLDYLYVDRKSEEFEVQYCFLEAFEDFIDLAQRAKKCIGGLTREIKDCVIFISRRGGLIYVHSNFLLPNRLYPTKFIAPRLEGVEFVLPLIINSKARSIRDDERLAAAHMLHVTYVVDSVFGDKMPFGDMMGALKIKRLLC